MPTRVVQVDDERTIYCEGADHCLQNSTPSIARGRPARNTLIRLAGAFVASFTSPQVRRAVPTSPSTCSGACRDARQRAARHMKADTTVATNPTVRPHVRDSALASRDR
jgi:hypothetical protein